MNENTPTGSKFITAYQCLVTPEYDQGCIKSDETSTYNCVDNKVVFLKTGDACSQAIQCETGSCNANQECADLKEDGEKCDYNHECKNKYCGIEFGKCNGKATPIQTSLNKTCQPAGHLKLNDECEDDVNCGKHNDVQMKCVESDPLIRATETQLGGVNINKSFNQFKDFFVKENYPFRTDYENKEDQIKIDTKYYNPALWPADDVFEKFGYGVTFKCKIPQNNKCRANFECPKKNSCEDGVCRGNDNAPCQSNDHCNYFKKLTCQMEADITSMNFGRTVCKRESAVAARRRMKKVTN